MRLLLLTPLALSLAGCLFTDDPQCFPGEERDRCALGEICVDRVCVPDPAAPDMQLDLDGAPDRGPPLSDLGATDGTRPDRGPVTDMASPDMASTMPCVPIEETCNAIDDDCDRRIDEDLDGCGTYPETCIWLERGTHTYLVCPEPVAQSAAETRCALIGDMRLAYTETCEEADWLGIAAEAIAAHLGYFDEGDLLAATKGWWLDLGFRVPGMFETLYRRRSGELGAERCWNPGEPNNLRFEGEECVSLLRSDDDGAELLYGWNDEICSLNLENRIGTICEFPCDPRVDRDRDGVDACLDCDDDDRTVPGDDDFTCPTPLPDFE